MTCRSCNHGWCWVCMEPWADHGSATGGYYKCNKFDEISKDPEFQKKQSKVEESKNELARYTFHFERFMNHEKSEKLAKKLLLVMEHKINQLHDIKQYPIAELNFLTDATHEVIRCRQFLKNTYVFAFYLPANVPTLEKQLFEFN